MPLPGEGVTQLSGIFFIQALILRTLPSLPDHKSNLHLKATTLGVKAWAYEFVGNINIQTTQKLLEYHLYIFFPPLIFPFFHTTIPLKWLTYYGPPHYGPRKPMIILFSFYLRPTVSIRKRKSEHTCSSLFDELFYLVSWLNCRLVNFFCLQIPGFRQQKVERVWKSKMTKIELVTHWSACGPTCMSRESMYTRFWVSVEFRDWWRGRDLRTLISSIEVWLHRYGC